MFGRATEVSRFTEFLAAGDHRKAMRFFDEVSGDPTACRLVLDALVMSNANQDDPQLHTPHGLQTTNAARAMLAISGFPAGVPLLRFVALYSFSLRRRDLRAEDVRLHAKGLPSPRDLPSAFRASVQAGDVPASGGWLARVALDTGLESAAHLALRTALDDIGKLGHHLALAAHFVDAARALDLPRGLVPLANLGFYLAQALRGVQPVAIPPLHTPGTEPFPERLASAAEEGAFDEVEAQLQALLAAGRTDDALRPLLVAASADPGFLGHTLTLAHALRIAAPFLSPAENFYVLWKAYRTLVSRFGYPEFLQLTGPSGSDPESAMEALRASLRYKSPPAEVTLRQCLEAGVPLDEVLATIVDAYGHWTVGEKEHTIVYLGAALETARFLGRERALLPLAVALMRLPF